jgi:spore germination cell wall hydrolase CwlJ-like protein
MKKMLRTAAFAVAAITLAAGATYADPLKAWENDSVAEAPSYVHHADAAVAIDDLALNETPAEAAAAGSNSEAATRHAFASAAQDLVHLADAAVPRPRALDELVNTHAGTYVPDSERECLAGAVYFEARGESLKGQLAVADVVLNRVASKKYPSTICEVVNQPYQFSFVVKGRWPKANKASEAWKKAVAIAHISANDLAKEIPSEVLWYHATYVSPGWGKRLNRVTQVGTHIFYS